MTREAGEPEFWLAETGVELRAHRIALGLSQREMACRYGCSQTWIGLIERRRRGRGSPETLDRVRVVLRQAWREQRALAKQEQP